MLSYVSGNQHLQKTKKHSFSLSKKIDNMKLWSLLALNGSFPLFQRSWESRLLLTQAGCCVLNSKVGLGSAMKKGHQWFT